MITYDMRCMADDTLSPRPRSPPYCAASSLSCPRVRMGRNLVASHGKVMPDSEGVRKRRRRAASSDDEPPRRKTVRWGKGEVDALLEGVRSFGVGKWASILRSSDAFNCVRTSVDLKDKWRNLNSPARSAPSVSAPPPHEHPPPGNLLGLPQLHAPVREPPALRPRVHRADSHPQSLAVASGLAAAAAGTGAMGVAMPANAAHAARGGAPPSGGHEPASHDDGTTPVDIRELTAAPPGDLEYFAAEFTVKGEGELERDAQRAHGADPDDDSDHLVHAAAHHHTNLGFVNAFSVTDLV